MLTAPEETLRNPAVDDHPIGAEMLGQHFAVGRKICHEAAIVDAEFHVHVVELVRLRASLTAIAN